MRKFCVLFCSAAALLLSACSQEESTLRVSQILIGSGTNESEEIVVYKDSFLPSDKTFYAHVFTEGFSKPEEVTGAWWYVPQDRKIFETSVEVTPQYPVAKFVLTNTTERWAAGEYLFTVFRGEKQLGEKSISVLERGE